MRHIRIAALAFSLAAASVPARADDAKGLRLAQELVEITRLADKIKGLLPMLGPTVQQALSREMVDPTRLEGATERVRNPSPDDLARLIQQVTALYAREFTDDQLADILTFYRTPTGRDMLAKEAGIGDAIGVLAQSWAVAVANRAVAEGTDALPSSASRRWRAEYIAAPSRAAVLQTYIDPLQKPEWTALRTVTLARLTADSCRGVRMDRRVLDGYLHASGLDAVSTGDLDTMNTIVAPAFSYFDTDRLRLVCAAAEDLFGPKGRLVPNLLSSGDGLPQDAGNRYIPVPPFADFPHGKG